MDAPPNSPSCEPAAIPAEVSSRYIRIEGWTSRFLPTPRDLFLYLPVAYAQQPDRSFPVMVMHDGQNLFDGSLSYVKGSTWRAGITVDAEVAQGNVEPLILLGIANTGTERMAEYTPTRDPRLGGGKGPLYARMLVKELLPEVRSRYRLLPGPENTAVAGSSLGGLISLWIGLKYAQVFGKLGVLSPSLWWNNRDILQTVSSLRHKPDLRVWLDMGTAEGAPHIANAEMLTRLLEQKGWHAGTDLASQIILDGVHSEVAWAARFGDVLRFLFPAK